MKVPPGSLIATLNLTIDNAPTSPNDKASEDFTIEIINIVVVAITTKLEANIFLLDKKKQIVYKLMIVNKRVR